MIFLKHVFTLFLTSFLYLIHASDANLPTEQLKIKCDHNDLASCLAASKILILKKDQKSFNQGISTLQKICDAKIPEGCKILAQLLEKQPNSSAENAIALFHLSCIYGDPTSCNKVVEIQKKYSVIHKEEMKHLFTDCIDYNKSQSCYLIGETFLTGNSAFQPNQKEALHYFDKSCKLNNATGCYQFAEVIFKNNSLGTPSEMTTSYKKSCSLKFFPSCHNLAIVLLEKAEHEKTSTPIEVKKMLKTACLGGFKPSCDELILIEKKISQKSSH